MALGFKLAVTFVKQLSKPLANQIKKIAIQNDSFRSFCIWFGRIEYRADAAMDKEIEEKSSTTTSTDTRSSSSSSSNGAHAHTSGGTSMDNKGNGSISSKSSSGDAGSKIMESGMKKISYASYLWTRKEIVLNEEEAVKRAAEYLGEAFIYTVAGVATAVEVYRSNQEKLEKQQRQKMEKLRQEEQIEHLADQIADIQKRLDELLGVNGDGTRNERRRRNWRLLGLL